MRKSAYIVLKSSFPPPSPSPFSMLFNNHIHHHHPLFLRKLLFNEIDLLMEQDELTKMYGPEAISDLIAMNPNSGSGESIDNEERTLNGGDSTPDLS